MTSAKHAPEAPQKPRSEKWRPSWFWPLAMPVLPFIDLISKITFTNPEKLPKHGPFILAVNHYSEIDPLVVARAVWKLGRAPRFLAKASLFKVPVVGAALRVTGQVPVERHGSGKATAGALSAADALVAHGRGVIVYPEGTLTREPDLWPMRGKTGAARLAFDAGLPVIPAAHWGVQEVMGRYSKKISLFPRKQVRMIFGDPIDLSDIAARRGTPGALNEATDRIMDGVTALLEQLRGEKAPAERWDPSKHQQSETGRFES